MSVFISKLCKYVCTLRIETVQWTLLRKVRKEEKHKQKLNAATSATVIEYVNKTLETVTKNAAIKAVSAIPSNGNSNGNNEINTGELPTKV